MIPGSDAPPARLDSMTQQDVPPTRQRTRDATSVPLARLLEALERWQEAPSDDGRASIVAAVAAIADPLRAHEALEAATTAIAAELDVDRVLQLIVDRVRDLIGARYAALGTADQRGRIERFITSGMSPEIRAAIGGVPHGSGLLGLIIREARTVRVAEISSHPESSGFPANHPAMHSFLGVPVLVKGRSVGNLYLAEKVDGDFTEDDE